MTKEICCIKFPTHCQIPLENSSIQTIWRQIFHWHFSMIWLSQLKYSIKIAIKKPTSSNNDKFVAKTRIMNFEFSHYWWSTIALWSSTKINLKLTFQFSNDLYAIRYIFCRKKKTTISYLKNWFHKHSEIRHDRLRLRRVFMHTQNIMQINFLHPKKTHKKNCIKKYLSQSIVSRNTWKRQVPERSASICFFTFLSYFFFLHRNSYVNGGKEKENVREKISISRRRKN